MFARTGDKAALRTPPTPYHDRLTTGGYARTLSNQKAVEIALSHLFSMSWQDCGGGAAWKNCCRRHSEEEAFVQCDAKSEE